MHLRGGRNVLMLCPPASLAVSIESAELSFFS